MLSTPGCHPYFGHRFPPPPYAPYGREPRPATDSILEAYAGPVESQSAEVAAAPASSLDVPAGTGCGLRGAPYCGAHLTAAVSYLCTVPEVCGRRGACVMVCRACVREGVGTHIDSFTLVWLYRGPFSTAVFGAWATLYFNACCP